MKLRVGTFNILNTSCRYQERKHLVRLAIDEMDCDVLGIQELNLQVNCEVFDLDKYCMSTVLLPVPMIKPDPSFRIDGNCVLVRKGIEVVKEERFVYSNQERVAQVLVLCKEGIQFTVVNTHLDHLSEEIRESQLTELLSHLSSSNHSNIICTGDFNFLPEGRPYNLISKTFKSSYLQIHLKEPQLTFPTGLIGDYADLDEYGCFDYIWIQNSISVQDSQVLRNCGSGQIWASDHYPLYSDLTIDSAS